MSKCPHNLIPGPRRGECYECWYQERKKPQPAYVPAAMSDKAMRVLEAIRAADAADEPLPSVRELQATCGISTTSVVSYTLRGLAREGYLTIGPKGHARSYRLTSLGRGARTPDELLLSRCLTYLELELSATGGALIEDLRTRLCA